MVTTERPQRPARHPSVGRRWLPAAALAVAGLTACSSGTSSAGSDSSSSTSPSSSSGEATESPTGSATPSDTPSVTATPSQGAGSAFADQPVGDIVAQARKAMNGVDSMHMTGAVTTDGQQIHLDLSLDRKGRCAGDLGIGKGTAQIVSTGGATSYLKADVAFYVAGGAPKAQAQQVAKLVGDRWLKVPDQGASFASLCDLDKLLGQLVSDDLAKKVVKGEVTDVNGQQVVGVKSHGSGQPSEGYVATEGEHYVLRVKKLGGGAGNQLDLSEFDKPVDAQAPPPSQVVDPTKLGG